MHRRLEPQLMEGNFQVEAFAAADKKTSINFFLNCIKNYFPDLTFADSLDLCCGPAEYDIALTTKFPGNIDAVDASLPMLKIAEKNVRLAKAEDCITLKNFYIPFTTNKKYDFIFSINSLHHFHNPADFWITVKSHSKQSTKILVIDLYRPSSEKVAETIVEYYSAEENELFKTDYHNSLLASFTDEELRHQLIHNDLKLNVEKIETRASENYMNVIWGEL